MIAIILPPGAVEAAKHSVDYTDRVRLAESHEYLRELLNKALEHLCVCAGWIDAGAFKNEILHFVVNVNQALEDKQ